MVTICSTAVGLYCPHNWSYCDIERPEITRELDGSIPRVPINTELNFAPKAHRMDYSELPIGYPRDIVGFAERTIADREDYGAVHNG